MATVTVKKGATPSEEIVDDANRVVFETDKRGRRIGFRKMSMSMRRRLFKILSAEAGSKVQYVGLAAVAVCVTQINDDPISFPQTESEIDFLIDRLDDDGFEAVGAGMKKHFKIGETSGKVADEAKN
ncbi:hypothetical protein DTW90_34540 [Neorhizobium sp. P12A]|uniref:hypothetical protein n=1 Tax=Neorhizobium sp. P12A TaxID=2268027 RepID=UPI0011ECFFA5|nr:hypothetical protein [Neorhizobium sp. P12A]KAA0686007.1 hypothetical protein DTW90_34540 [Neorhizobium sp. P12A]